MGCGDIHIVREVASVEMFAWANDDKVRTVRVAKFVWNHSASTGFASSNDYDVPGTETRLHKLSVKVRRNKLHVS
jgi:hypothetical protein